MSDPTVIEKELTGMLVQRTGPRDTAINVTGSGQDHGVSVLLSDKSQAGDPETKFFRGAKVSIRIEFDQSREFTPHDH